MTISLHNLKPARGSRQKKQRVGRGNASGRGNYSQRGIKGQKARSGGTGKLTLLAIKRNIQNLPKLGGFTALVAKKAAVTTGTLDRICKKGDIVTPFYLKEKGVIETTHFGVKIIFTGALSKSITIKGCSISAGAKEVVEKAGGKVILQGKKIAALAAKKMAETDTADAEKK